ncbi:MAG: DUF4190 domain-containing protein [Ignavibacteriae bacterium]|nr:DUF4190 domain-containing protein [Ignavibacteriota bacterium]
MNNNVLYSQDGNMGGYQPPPPPPPPTGYAPPPPPPPPSYGGQYTPQDKASSAAIWALVLGIASWVLCGIIAAIPAWIIGKKELNAINEGRSSQAGKSMAQVGMWLGIIQVIIGVLAIIAVIVYFIFIAILVSN